MIIDMKREMIHDTTMSEYRDPVGSLKAGETVTIRFKTRCPDIKSVYLKMFKENYDDMRMMDRTDGHWVVKLTVPNDPDVYWYYFCINVSGKVYYYGADGRRTSGAGNVYTDSPPAFQMTVYDAAFDTPQWLKKSIMYQIFPDRYRRTDPEKVKQSLEYHIKRGRSVYFHEDWNDLPFHTSPDGNEVYTPNDYFGGTLKGIEESLDELKTLGINVIYLNPVFEAASNHRYNTADYMKIDPVLGTNQDFSSLCKTAKNMGIRIILDGVFSHTGSDSIYFNRENAYESMGAYNSQESPYYSWYQFDQYPTQYKSWWGFTTLPEVDEKNEDWQSFIIKNDDSVLRHWIAQGASGYRLDVADELPDETIMLMREATKDKDKDAVLIGEVWEDATTKYSYGKKRKYALGRELDSVTNYPCRNEIVNFLTGKTDAAGLKDFLISQAVNYPLPMYHSLMNLLSSHDIERIRTALSIRIDIHTLTREQQAGFVINPSQDLKGAKLQRIAAAIQFSLPGVPCIYYGDETGMQGFLDPFNRATYRKGINDLTKFYSGLCTIRNNADALTTGNIAILAPDSDCLGILRYILNEKDVFGKQAESGVYFTAVNRSDQSHNVVFDFLSVNQLMTADEKTELRHRFRQVAGCLLTQNSYEICDGLLEITLPPYGIAILKMA